MDFDQRKSSSTIIKLTFTSPIINIKCGLLLHISTTIYSKLMINKSKSSEVWLGERYNKTV